MTLKDFLTNPSGKGDTALNTKAIASILDSKYSKLLEKKERLIKCTIYKVLTKEVYYIHLVIPTETERDNTYDVVIQLSDLEGAHKHETSIVNYDAKFFSNAPSFAYTYAKVYRDNELLIQSLQNKFDKQQLTGNPDMRNRYGIVGYDKYLYFGVKYIMESKMLSKLTIGYRSIRYSAAVFVPQIRSIDKIMQEYHRAEQKLKKSKDKSGSDKQQKERTNRSLQGDAGIYKKPVSPVSPKAKVTGTGAKTVKRVKKK